MKTAFPWGKRHKFLQSFPASSTDTPFLQYSVHHRGCERRRGDLEPLADKKTHTHIFHQQHGGCGVSDLWDEVQECISWEGPHSKTHKQLQDEGVGILTGVEKDQADTEHGTHGDDQDGHCTVAILWKDNVMELHSHIQDLKIC